jgi:molecular chaperone HscC
MLIPVSKTETVCTAHENQKYVTVKVLQGESRVASNNLLLGELTVEVPVGPKGKESVEITYTYDINSLLEVEVKVLSTGEKKKVIIQDEENRISEEEAEQRLERIQYLKQNPREDVENILVMFRAERIYEECSVTDQNRLAEKINEFETAMRTKTRIEADSVRKQLHELLDELENRNDRGFLA